MVGQSHCLESHKYVSNLGFKFQVRSLSSHYAPITTYNVYNNKQTLTVSAVFKTFTEIMIRCTLVCYSCEVKVEFYNFVKSESSD